MSEMEMTNDVETEEFTDDLSDDALDREQGRSSSATCCPGPGREQPFRHTGS